MDEQPFAANASPAQLAGSVEGNLFALFRRMATLPGGEIVETPRLSKHNAPFANPMFRGVWATRLDETDAGEAIAETLAWFQERNAPFVFWWTGPRTTPADLPAHLRERGFIPWEEAAPGMVATIDELDAGAMRRVPPGLTIEPVRDDADLDTFTAELVAAFGMPEWAAHSWNEATRAVGIARAPWSLYLARVAGEPAGTAMLVKGGGVAGVTAIAVREAWRNRGIGAAISLQPLLDARREGYRHAALFATPMGEPVYARLGFRRCNVPISRYLWRNEAR
jgi:GNAT superfamily N-acetyltransferase